MARIPFQPHRHWEAIINTMADGLMVVDPQGLIRFANQALEDITGYSRGELLGKSCQILKCNTCQGKIPGSREHNCDLFLKGEFKRSRCTLIRKDGRPLAFLKNATAFRDEKGRILGGVETFTDLTELEARDQVICHLRQELGQEEGFFGLVGHTPVMTQLFQLLKSAALSEAPVILYGESGTGKELAAAALHRLSPRAQGPYIKVNSAALTESLLESELFGHVKGAFTGADRTRVGRFEAAHRGSIFLDEIGDLPLTTQAKLLRVLQEKVVERVGDHRPIPVDVRIITATHQDLEKLMAQGRFREDLFYRINVIPIHLPPLRERREDIPLLVEHFLRRKRAKAAKPPSGLSRAALEVLLDYHWPGNVRELLNVLDYALVLCREGPILPEHLPVQLMQPAGKENLTRRGKGETGPPGREALLAALKAVQGNRTAAARRLGVSRVTLWKWLKDYDIQVETVIK